jgi:D-alanine-D-alanine ligase-like ATP-grasp enzyme
MGLLLNQRQKTKAWSLWHRAMFYMDFRSVARILKYRKLREEYYRSLWAQSAKNIDANITFTKFGFTKISKGNWATYVKLYEMMFDSPLMLNIMGNKALVYDILSELQAPVVPHQVFTVSTPELANSFIELNKSVVVKPASGTGGGRGVTTHITTKKQLKAATRLAARFDCDLIVEKQIEGQNFRLLYLDGQFIDAIRRDPPQVTGDGVHSIRQLIKQENRRREKERPFRALSPLVIDNDLNNWMQLNDIGLSDVPAKNQVVQIKCATNENDCNGNINVTNLVSHEIISRCSQIVNNIGVKFAGVDLICRDITGSFTSGNCYVGEINTTPGLHHHYLISNNSEGCQVAEVALRYLFQNQLGIVNSSNEACAVTNTETKEIELSHINKNIGSKKHPNKINSLEVC